MEKNNLTLGSLFDGSGGFPLGGIMSGITPIWASEIEPFAIRVTSKRMPNVKHYGDITEMDGGKIEPVDIITFGSPCQDMSVAGKRSGLDGSRSSLFYEAIRIVKEMRRETNGKYPRYIVWENVPGAFSSNGGQDFKSVLEEIISVKEENAEVPMPTNNEWAYADCIYGNGWSVAYRVLDAQYWGVPQRRRRIYLVADFGGKSAYDILFKSEGLSRYSTESFRSWQRTANNFEESVRASGIAFDGYNGSIDEKCATLGVNCGMSTGRNGIVLNDQGGNRMDITKEVTCTLRAKAHHPPCVMEESVYENHGNDVRYKGPIDVAPTIAATYGMGGNNQPFVVKEEQKVFDNQAKNVNYPGPIEVAPTITAMYGTGGNNQPFVVNEETPKTLKIRSGCEGGGKGALIQDNKSATLSCNNDQTLFEPKNWNGEKVAGTLTTKNAGGNQRMPDIGNFNCILEPFGICAKDSNSMKSSNPKSGIYKAETSRTLDGNGGNPSCNQGGIAVVCANAQKEAICIQGSVIGRKDENGPQGDGIKKDVSFTLNATDRHAVYAMTTGSFQQVEEEKSPTLMARDFKDPNAVCYGFDPSASRDVGKYVLKDKGNTLINGSCPGHHNGVIDAEYTVRRLTPTECARLQGFPDFWCSNLGTEKPTDEDVYFWYKVFNTYSKVVGTTKPKTDKQIRTWLKDPHTDSAEYKMWGNGVALSCVFFVLSGIVWANENNI